MTSPRAGAAILVDIVVDAEDRKAALNAIRRWDEAYMAPGLFRMPVTLDICDEACGKVRLCGVPDESLPFLRARGIRCAVCGRG
jgi:hypothetical protein